MTDDRRPPGSDWEPAEAGTLLAQMADVMKVENHPLGYEESPPQKVRELYASCWTVQGFTDPREAQRWIQAGVEAAKKAADAVEAGYRPGDPWVERSGPSFTLDERRLARPGVLRTMRNRRRAAREWREQQRRNYRGSRRLAEAAMLLEGEGGSPLMVLGLLADSDPSTTDVTPDHIWRALAELDMQLAVPARSDDPVSYWETMVRLIDRTAGVCEPVHQARIRTHLLELSERITTRRVR